MKRILIICNVFPNLSETFVRNHIDFLQGKGYKVDILATHHLKKNNILIKYENNVLGYYSFIQKVLFFPFILIKILLSNPKLALDSINFMKYGKDAIYLKLLYALHFTRRKKYDLIISHFGRSGNVGAFIKENVIPYSKLITIFHGRDIREGESKGSHIFNPTFKLTDTFISVSDVSYNYISQNNIFGVPILDIPNGVDAKTFTVKEYNEYSNIIHIVSVGRLVPEKNYFLALEAIHDLIKNKKAKIHYTIVGSGPLEREINTFISNNNLQNHITLLGDIPNEKIKEIFHKNDVFLLTSSKETGPIVTLEARFCGLPVISTDVGRVKKQIDDNKNGFLVYGKNDIIESIIFFYKNKEKISKYGRDGLDVVRREYSQEKLNNDLLKIIHDLIGK